MEKILVSKALGPFFFYGQSNNLVRRSFVGRAASAASAAVRVTELRACVCVRLTVSEPLAAAVAAVAVQVCRYSVRNILVTTCTNLFNLLEQERQRKEGKYRRLLFTT